VIATEGEDPVLVRKGKTMAATFHPELTPDAAVHEIFVRMASIATAPGQHAAARTANS